MRIRNISVIYVSENVRVVKIWKVTSSSTTKNITIAPNVSNRFPWTSLRTSACTCSSTSTCWLPDPTNASLAEKSSKSTRFCKHIWRKPDLTIMMSVYSVILGLRHMMSMSDMYFKYILENGFTGKPFFDLFWGVVLTIFVHFISFVQFWHYSTLSILSQHF